MGRAGGVENHGGRKPRSEGEHANGPRESGDGGGRAGPCRCFHLGGVQRVPDVSSHLIQVSSYLEM